MSNFNEACPSGNHMLEGDCRPVREEDLEVDLCCPGCGCVTKHGEKCPECIAEDERCV